MFRQTTPSYSLKKGASVICVVELALPLLAKLVWIVTLLATGVAASLTQALFQAF